LVKKKISQNAVNKIYFLVLFFFFLSGLSGLIYEMLWTRMTVKIIGSAPFAVSIILTIFMGGLGFGSYLAGRIIDRITDSLALVKIYGLLELSIGAYAMVIPLLLTSFRPLQTILYNGFYGHFILYNLLTFILCSVIFCFPVICMGATLPILCRFYVTRLSHLGTHAGRLYGLNTIGAACGSLVCGFWLINLWGVSGTLVFAVLVNFMIGISCLMVSYQVKVKYRSGTQKASGSKKRPLIDEAIDDQPVNSLETKSALVIFSVSGFCAMACEVIWTRLLGLIVGPTTYSFTIVLVTFITGLALGSMIFGYFSDKVKKCMWLLLFTQITAALFVLAVSQILGSSQLFFAKLFFKFKGQFGLLSLLKAVILFMFMILPTICFGATFPLVGKIYTKSVSKVGESIGFAYMLNTVGSLLGSFCAGFLLIPLAGKELGIGIVVCLQLIVLLVITGIILKNKKESIKQFGVLAVPAMVGIILCFYYPVWNHHLLSRGKYHRFEKIRASIVSTGWLEALCHGSKILSRSEKNELVYYGDGIGGFTTVEKYFDAFGNTKYSMSNSGKVDASSHADMKTQTLLAHFPMLFHKNPKTIMVVGLASGITAGEVLCYPVEQLDVLEINDQVVAASNIFIPWNNKVLSAPKTNLIIQDARAHLQLSRQRYDVIISEPSNPWMAGLAALFTHDFFTLAKEKLNDDGVFVQWMHLYQMDLESFALVGRTFAQVFPNSLLVSPSKDGRDYLLIGFKGKDRLDLEYAKQKLTSIRKSKNMILLNPRLLYRLIVSEDLQMLFGKGNINTDNRPLLEFAAPKLMYQDDVQILKKFPSQKWQSLSPVTKKIIQQVMANVDDQIDFAAYTLSLFNPFHDMVDLSKATSSQKERFFGLMEDYCANNEVDYSIFKDKELKQRCAAIQINIIQNKIDLLPNRLASCYYLGYLYNIRGRLSEAVSYYTEALQIDPYSVVIHNNLGLSLAKQGRLDEAISHYSEALRIDPAFVYAHNNLGIALVNVGRFDEAISHYSEALRIDPAFADAHNNLGIALAKQGRLDEAISHYSKALLIRPRYTKAHNNLGNALVNVGRLDEAISHYSEALRTDLRNLKAHNNLGLVLAKQGKLDAAISHYSEALRIDPAFADAHNNLGIVLAKQGRFDKAISHFAEALRLNSGDAKAHNNLGFALAKQGRLDEAISHYFEALKIDPAFVYAHNNLGLVLTKQDKLDEAISHYSEALRIDPAFAYAHNNLGIALAKQGRLDEAISHYSKALLIRPRYTKAHNNLGNALVNVGRLDEAISHYSEALRIIPSFMEARDNLNKALTIKGK